MTACFWQPSRFLLRAHLVLCVLALVALMMSGLPLMLKMPLIGLCLIWGVIRVVQGRQLGHASQCVGLRHEQRTGWQLWTAERGWQHVEVLSGSLVTWRLVIVRVRDVARGKRKTLLLPEDVLEHDSHRRLRLWLRLTPVLS